MQFEGLLAPSKRYRPLRYPESNGDGNVRSEIALTTLILDPKAYDKDQWDKLPLAHTIGIPLEFMRLTKSKSSEQPENMFAEIMILKTDGGVTYYPDNPREGKSIHGGIIVARTDDKSLSTHDIQVMWDYIHRQFSTDFDKEVGLLPRSYLNDHQALNIFVPKDEVSKAKGAKGEATQFPQPEELVKIIDGTRCWVADRKYAFDVLREAWQTKGKAKDGFVGYWNSLEEAQKKADKHYKKLKCPVKEHGIHGLSCRPH